MKKNRLESFSDAVLSILITILVLDLKVPAEPTFAALINLWPVYLAYLISFLTIFMMWLAHHHIFAEIDVVDHKIQWANGFFLLMVSQIPFVTEFVGTTRWGSEVPVFLYGLVMLMITLSLFFLKVACTKPETIKSAPFRANMKVEIFLMMTYLAAALLAWVHPKISLTIYILAIVVQLYIGKPYRKKLD